MRRERLPRRMWDSVRHAPPAPRALNPRRGTASRRGGRTRRAGRGGRCPGTRSGRLPRRRSRPPGGPPPGRPVLEVVSIGNTGGKADHVPGDQALLAIVRDEHHLALEHHHPLVLVGVPVALARPGAGLEREAVHPELRQTGALPEALATTCTAGLVERGRVTRAETDGDGGEVERSRHGESSLVEQPVQVEPALPRAPVHPRRSEPLEVHPVVVTLERRLAPPLAAEPLRPGDGQH